MEILPNTEELLQGSIYASVFYLNSNTISSTEIFYYTSTFNINLFKT